MNAAPCMICILALTICYLVEWNNVIEVIVQKGLDFFLRYPYIVARGIYIKSKVFITWHPKGACFHFVVIVGQSCTQKVFVI